MKKYFLGMALAISLLAGPAGWAQDESKHEEARKSVTPLRVQVVFTEFDGEKKIGSFPYTLLVNADDKGPRASIRMGLRVPIMTAGGETKQFTYIDLGTNLDGSAQKTEESRFSLQLNVERTSVYTPSGEQKVSDTVRTRLSDTTPVIQQFRSQINLILRDGQSMPSTVSTDPLTGHVLKVDVTLNVIK
jgi:hypothetical protein